MSDDTGGSGTGSVAASSAAPVAAESSSAPISTPASATATPEATGSPAAASSEFGPIPYERFKQVNDELKTLKAFREKYGWSEQFEQQPYEFVENWMDQLAQHAEYSPKLLAKAARMLQSRRGTQPAPAAEEPQADVPIVDGNGNVVNQTYSASQLKKWQQWNHAQQEAALAERFAPLEATQKELQQQRETAQLHEQAQTDAASTLTNLRQDPLFKEHEPKVKAALIAHPEWGDDVKAAYIHVLTTHVLPQRDANVVSSLKTQAAAATISPGQQSATSKPKFKSFGEAAKYYEQHPAERAAMADR